MSLYRASMKRLAGRPPGAEGSSNSRRNCRSANFPIEVAADPMFVWICLALSSGANGVKCDAPRGKAIVNSVKTNSLSWTKHSASDESGGMKRFQTYRPLIHAAIVRPTSSPFPAGLGRRNISLRNTMSNPSLGLQNDGLRSFRANSGAVAGFSLFQHNLTTIAVAERHFVTRHKWCQRHRPRKLGIRDRRTPVHSAMAKTITGVTLMDAAERGDAWHRVRKEVAGTALSHFNLAVLFPSDIRT